MLSSRRLSLGTSLMLSMMGLASSAAHVVSRPFEGMSYSPRFRLSDTDRARSATNKARKAGQRKSYRTVRAETHQGRILRHHFDANRLTRSQMKKFYAGKSLH